MRRMRIILTTFLAFFYCCFIHTSFAIAASNSPVGLWKTIDDASGTARSVIKISPAGGEILQGRIVKIFLKPGEKSKLCSECKGSKHNQPIEGMVILTGLKYMQDKWSGQILDPENGKVYKCNVTVSSDGNKLYVRGYIGVSLFGRTQTWLRM